MSPEAPKFAYEKQFDRQATRTCGAACLSMVYGSFGQEVSQRVIWPLIAKKNQYGSIASTTYLMVADALTRGLSAVAIQSRDPLQTLRVCRDLGIRAIMNHRLMPDSPAGHYTVFVDIDDTHVTLHDPYFGPARRIEHDVLRDLWQPRLPESEIVGNFLIGFTAEPKDVPPCKTCGASLARSVQCPRCKSRVPLQPIGIVGCLNNACSARLWNYVCCHSCDLTWSFTVDSPRAAAAVAAPESTALAPAASASAASSSAAAPAASASDPPDLSKAFQAIDNFCALIRANPEAASHPDVQKQLEYLASNKEKLIAAQAEAAINSKLYEDQLAAMVQASNARQEAHQKKLDELKKPIAPADGDALARALLKNLGFIS